MMEEIEPFHVTQEGLERLYDRLAYLKRILPERAEETRRTAAYGDRSENDEYRTARGALGRTKWQILEIEDQIKRAVVITPGASASGAAKIGSSVTLDEGDGGDDSAEGAAKKTFQIVGSHEADPARGRISYRSPLGAALLDRRKGDIVEVESINGMKKYRIADIR